MDEIVRCIEVWYDGYTRSWVVQRMDGEGNQIENADYVYTKAEAIAYAKTYSKDYEDVKIKIFKRNGGM